MPQKQQRGFSLIEIILVIAVIAVLIGVGWYALNRRQEKKDAAKTPPTSVLPQVVDAHKDWKDFANSKVQVYFSHPADWVVKEAISDVRGEGLEGTISVTSPKGFVVHVDPNFGGRGGACPAEPGDTPHHTRNCPTEEVLATEKIPYQLQRSTVFHDNEMAIYLVTVKFTEGRESTAAPAGQTNYKMYLTNNDYIVKMKAEIGLFTGSGVVALKDRNVDTSVTGVDFTSETVMKSDDWKTAQDILRSVSIH